MSGGDWRRAFAEEINAMVRFGFKVSALELYMHRNVADGEVNNNMELGM